jgi:hypothetical protein
MKRLFMIIPVAMMMVNAGCASFFRFRDSKPERDFPDWANGQCFHALNSARDAIQSKGTTLKDKSIRVAVVPGQKQFGTQWAWFVSEPSWPDGGMWVGGLTSSNGRLIQIVIDPARATEPAAIHMGSLIHEMAHHWLKTNGYGSDHPAIYDDVIPGWHDARVIVGKGEH